MQRAVVYVRISSDPEGRKLGVARQEADCRKLASSRGWKVVAVYSDNDISAASGRRRPQWEALLDAIRAGEVDAVVAYSASRMYRRVADLGTFIEVVKERGVEVATVASGRIVLDTADGRMLAGILASIDQGEAERVSERTSRHHAAAAANGEVHGSLGFGFRGSVVDEGEASAIRDAASRVLSGESLGSIVASWNAAGFRTSRGGTWTGQTLRRVLLAPRIAGLRVHRGTTYPARWDAIIDPRTWARVVEVIKDPARVSPPTRGKYLLSGILRCAECDSKMKAQPARGVPAYICASAVGGCGRVRIMAAKLEEYVARIVFDQPARDAVVVPDPGSVDARITDAIAAEEAKLVRLNTLRIEEDMPASEYAATAAPIRERIRALEAELGAVAAPPPPQWSSLWEALQTVPESWDEFIADPENRASTRAAIEREVEAVGVRRATNGRWTPVSDRVAIKWRS